MKVAIVIEFLISNFTGDTFKIQQYKMYTLRSLNKYLQRIICYTKVAQEETISQVFSKPLLVSCKIFFINFHTTIGNVVDFYFIDRQVFVSKKL